MINENLAVSKSITDLINFEGNIIEISTFGGGIKNYK